LLHAGVRKQVHALASSTIGHPGTDDRGIPGITVATATATMIFVLSRGAMLATARSPVRGARRASKRRRPSGIVRSGPRGGAFRVRLQSVEIHPRSCGQPRERRRWRDPGADPKSIDLFSWHPFDEVCEPRCPGELLAALTIGDDSFSNFSLSMR
jgi:hypothetical protein